jgi:23S rRNA (uracil1939-C5)-methyltransferase
MADRARRRTRASGGGVEAGERVVEVVGIAKGGDGVGFLMVEGGGWRAVLVAGAVPGDRVRAEVASSGGVLRARVLELLSASPLRVQPPCEDAGRCGGCDLMHLELAAQRRERRGILARALSGLMGDSPQLLVHEAASHTGYRSRARLGVLARDRVVAGYRARRSRELVQVARCAVLEPEIESARAGLAGWLEGSRGTGEASVYAGAGGMAAIELRWSGELAPTVFARAADAVRERRWAGASVWLDGAREPAIVGDARGYVRGSDGGPLWTAPAGFAQANPAMSAVLGRRVLQLARCDGERVVELFCGAGNFTVGLAPRTASLVAVESEAAAVAHARENLRSRSLSARLVCADANAFQIPAGTRLVVLDPPRTGAAGAARNIAASRARRVLLVSCDPATLGRDAAILAGSGRLRLTRVELFEMFPHTSQIEALAVFERPDGGSS